METKNKNIKTFAGHLDKRHGKTGTEELTLKLKQNLLQLEN
ncbi:hypothetical protein QGN23_04085 [Chryseobacterium gotjawalense]|uniref:Uncharacterized protein n=1 Tax=Chryseobacterium gotjawalense TaxID=3042315 RepID=A0ABY8REU3_9FLAO|nr:hypothetical protein [Chryseobacterium sp. wdc7]WHF52465.1 hypothetical protein QGN23_04085 [Chryseobacterium sp. wdc7]